MIEYPLGNNSGQWSETRDARTNNSLSNNEPGSINLENLSVHTILGSIADHKPALIKFPAIH